MLRNVRKLFSVRALPRIIFKRPAVIPIARKTQHFPKTLVTLVANTGVVYLANKEVIDNCSVGPQAEQQQQQQQQQQQEQQQQQQQQEQQQQQRDGESGRRALTDLLNTLRDQTLSVSAQYQKCLDQQMMIMNEGLDHIMEDTWEELRTMSKDLKVELDNLLVVVSTVGRMLQLEAKKYPETNKDFVPLIQKKIRELDNLLNQEMKKVKKLEKNELDMEKKLKI